MYMPSVGESSCCQSLQLLIFSVLLLLVWWLGIAISLWFQYTFQCATNKGEHLFMFMGHFCFFYDMPAVSSAHFSPKLFLLQICIQVFLPSYVYTGSSDLYLIPVWAYFFVL